MGPQIFAGAAGNPEAPGVLRRADAEIQAARLGADTEVQTAWLRADAEIQAVRLRADAEIQAARLRADAANQAAREAKELLDFVVNGRRRHHYTVVKEVDATKRK
ncbi:hypothetical protein CHLRE_13g583287v5 [Chlamydomonas reinhardtii]|uniref:Uncharacterized protein n=1 Tax=Chlamydomonas reinhardtii TaxID=3055 RepID=A0A2K3D0M4_CHLRE|nr:uncharacterized protein CHLRE_13g583287v5 [Chlamydomonas reinhardtii]PNW74049.1 hypothetical protein CHLRE_13g583287v5 [Chlamydomonas reinhardtii]